ncbi:hypothetical protein ACG02S_11510 [Roseateles sp. DC23W]|uniref:Uncharacterized protein n=1 Tax=Pelomonas dachongensis TaxID=3299029 RepID=A0ABW7EM05_9BURK
MDPTLTWLLVLAAAVLMLFSAVRFDLLAARWRDILRTPPPPRDAPPAPRSLPVPRFQPHDAPVHKPAFHRSGRRH